MFGMNAATKKHRDNHGHPLEAMEQSVILWLESDLIIHYLTGVW